MPSCLTTVPPRLAPRRTARLAVRVGAGIAALAVAACGREPTAPQFSLTGVWLADWPAPGGDGAIALQLEESGGGVRGTGAARFTRTDVPRPFGVSGTVRDPDVTLNFATLAGCPAVYQGRRAGSPPAYSRDSLVGRLVPSPCTTGSPTLVFRRQR